MREEKGGEGEGGNVDGKAKENPKIVVSDHLTKN